MIKKIIVNSRAESVGERMLTLAKELFPLNRSIMGPDIRNSLNYFLNNHSEFKILKFKTGEKVFDWEIPEEWIIRDGFIMHESGKKFADFKQNNLHIMGYSVPINKKLTKKQLQKNIFTLPTKPDSIPYVTSYYKKDWGFCLSHEEYNNLPDGNYKVLIDSQHNAGELWLIEAVLPGKSEKEIFFSTYLCHPSMANNELSGPVLLNEIINYVKEIKNRKFTYRFVILPETIGSISYLSKRKDKLKKNLIFGLNLSCVGDERGYSIVHSRNEDNLAEIALSSSLINLKNVKEYSFLDRGSDERQYCAPGIDLPMCTFCRTKFGEYPEYHTSKDNFDVVTSEGLIGSYKVIQNIINAFELGIYPKVNIFCEPQLGKRNLYPNISKYDKGNPVVNRMNIIAFCDSKHNVFEISRKLNINLEVVIKELKLLHREHLITFVNK